MAPGIFWEQDRFWPKNRLWNVIARFGSATVIIAFAFLLIVTDLFLIRHFPPFMLFFSAVLMSAWYCGFWPGVYASFLSSVILLYFFLEPAGVVIYSSENSQQILLYVLISLLFCRFAHSIRQIKDTLHATNARLEKELAQRSEIELALGASESQAQRLAMVARRTINGVIITDANRRIQWVNEGFTRITGYSLDEVFGKVPGHVLQGPNTDPETVTYIRERLRSGSGFTVELLNYRKGGQPYWVRVEVQPLSEENGHLSGFMAIETDITERKSYEEALLEAKEKAEEANRAKSAFLAAMSHEIRTPLTAILGFSSLLSNELKGVHREFAQSIENGGRRLKDTLDALLTIARLESGRLRLDLQPLKVVPEVEQIVHFFERQARDNGLELKLEVLDDADELFARLDRGGLTSVLQNLISNAIKFTPSGFVAVRVGRTRDTAGSQDQLFIEVTDTGIGIHESFIPHLFEQFSQESTGDDRSFEGSGLGLAITRQLVEKMGGQISVTSRQGQGSTFLVNWPLTRLPDLRLHRSSEFLMDNPSTGHRHVLVVEDNLDAQSLIRVLLNNQLDLTIVDNAEEAIEITEKAHFDLVIMDINLGGPLTGTDVMRHLRNIPDYQNTPVIAITAYALPGDSERLIRAGFDAYLAKPFDPQQLTLLTHQLLAA